MTRRIGKASRGGGSFARTTREISYSVSCQKSVLDRARAPRQASICSKHSETGSKTVHVSEALDELEEAQQDSVQARLCCGC